MEEQSSHGESAQSESSVLKDLTTKISKLLGQVSSTTAPELGAISIGIKLDGSNYGLWSQVIEMFISGKDKLGYINGELPQLSCVQNFPKTRGPVVGILKGFAGLSGAILTQVYTAIHSPDHASLIFMVAVGPAMVVIALMFIVRPVGGHRQVRPSDGASASFVYSVCLLLAAYLMVVMLLEDLVELSHTVIIIFTVILFVLILVPIIIPVYSSFIPVPRDPSEEALLSDLHKQEHGKPEHDPREVIFSEVEDEKPKC